MDRLSADLDIRDRGRCERRDRCGALDGLLADGRSLLCLRCDLFDARLARVVDAVGELGGLSAPGTRHSRQPAPGVANFARLG